MPSYNPARDITPAFIERVAGWIANSGEVLVILRYLTAGGWRDYALCRTGAEFEAIIDLVPEGTEVVVLRDRQLPIRGTVTEAFVVLALDSVPDGTEYLVLSMETQPGSRISRRVGNSDSHENLREALESMSGVEVALGVCPDFWDSDHEGLISAAKWGIDGAR